MRKGKWHSKPGAPPRAARRQNRTRDRRQERRQERRTADDGVILYGWHTVTAALTNPKRRTRHLFATENALPRLADEGVTVPVAPEIMRPDAFAARLTPDAVHQGMIAKADPLPSPDIEDLPASGILLVLDQI